MRATFLATAAAGCFLAVSAAASTLTPTPTAMVSYLGNGSQYNDSATNAFVIDFIDNYTPFDSSTLVQLDRVNSPNLNEGGILSVSYTGGAPSTMGSWTSTSAISIVAYKNGAGFTMAYYSPSVTSATLIGWPNVSTPLTNRSPQETSSKSSTSSVVLAPATPT